MASRRTPTMDVHEVVRLLQAGASDREVAQRWGRSRRTVARYRRWAEREGVLAGPLAALGRDGWRRAWRRRCRDLDGRAVPRGDRGAAGAGRGGGGDQDPAGGAAPGADQLQRGLAAGPPAGAADQPGDVRAGGGAARGEAQVDFGAAGGRSTRPTGGCGRPGCSCWCWPGAATATPRWCSTSGSRPGCCATATGSSSSAGCPSGWCWTI